MDNYFLFLFMMHDDAIKSKHNVLFVFHDLLVSYECRNVLPFRGVSGVTENNIQDKVLSNQRHFAESFHDVFKLSTF